MAEGVLLPAAPRRVRRREEWRRGDPNPNTGLILTLCLSSRGSLPLYPDSPMDPLSSFCAIKRPFRAVPRA